MFDLRLPPLDDYAKSKLIETLGSIDLPPYACFECAAMIKNTYFFTEKCMRGQTALCNVLNSMGMITETKIKEIDRYNLNLVSHLSCHTICEDSIIDVKYKELEPVRPGLCNQDISHIEPNFVVVLEVKPEIKHENDVDETSFTIDDNLHKQTLQPKSLSLDNEAIKRQLQRSSQVERVRQCKPSIDKKKKQKLPKEPPQKSVKNLVEEAATSGWKENVNWEKNFKIDVLSKEEQLEELEKLKTSSKYLDAAFKCELCYKGFVDKAAWETHRSRHDPKNGDPECEICKYRFKTKAQMQKHLAQHETRYACKMCPYVTGISWNAKQHDQRHKGVKYRCKHCGACLDTNTAFLSHVRLKHPSEFVCSECGHSFVSRLGLTMHKTRAHKVADKCEVGARDEGQHCAECDVKFATQDAYRRHLNTSAKHNHKQIQNYNMNALPKRQCRKKGRSKERARPVPRARPFSRACEHCPEVLESRRAYWDHYRRVHPRCEYPKDWKNICDQCGKSFKNSTLLKYHVITHSSQRPYKCPQCPKSFHDAMRLRMHQPSHSDARPFACTPCDKTFKSKSALYKHNMFSVQHGGLRPHKCELCDKAFGESAGLRVHVRTVHLKEPYPKRVRKRKDTT